MLDLLDQPWLGWAIGVAIGLPIVLIILTEVHNHLTRRDSRMARSVAMLRNYIVPALALLVLLTQVGGLTRQVTSVRLVATVFAFLLLLFVLSGINVALFGRAELGSWRRRLPSIFIDIGRLIIIAIGLAILLSQVWGADVGALFTALGVTSIVIGLALQNAVGSIISGLLLLFEAPFALGDTLETSSAKGRVVEVNWRAVHIETGNAVQIIPNSSLATGSFANLSRPTMAVDETLKLKFAVDDSPSQVCTLLEELAADLRFGMAEPATAVPTGSGGYELTLHLANLADAAPAHAQLLSWVWYASRRAGLHLDGSDPAAYATTERLTAAARFAAPSLQIAAEEAVERSSSFTLQRYGAGEIVQRAGQIPDRFAIVIDGQLQVGAEGPDGSIELLTTIQPAGYVNPTALTQEAARLAVVAATESTVLSIPVDTVQQLTVTNPRLARDMTEEIDRRRSMAEPAKPATSRETSGLNNSDRRSVEQSSPAPAR